MKLFACILSLYILALTAMPCVDVHQDCLLHKAELSQSTNDSHKDDVDRCSPFCTCDCCTSPVLQKDNVIHFNCTPIPQKCEIGYSSSYISSLFTTIWHPPKISWYSISPFLLTDGFTRRSNKIKGHSDFWDSLFNKILWKSPGSFIFLY